jgi:hypothetical protein
MGSDLGISISSCGLGISINGGFSNSTTRFVGMLLSAGGSPLIKL